MFEQAFRNIDGVLRKEAGCTTELDYTEQTFWLLFLKYLDGLEEDKRQEAALEGKKYSYILEKPYRGVTWAAPKAKDGTLDHHKALTINSTSSTLHAPRAGAMAWTQQVCTRSKGRPVTRG